MKELKIFFWFDWTMWKWKSCLPSYRANLEIQEERLPNARLDLTCFIEWKGKWHILKRQTLASSIHWLSESETEATYVFVEAENNTGIVVECNTSQASDYQELEDGSM